MLRLRAHRGVAGAPLLSGQNRKTSEANGFKVWLCLAHHTGSNRAVHGKDGGLLTLTLKKHCQMEFEKTHTRAEFMALIGRNYL